MSVIRPYIPLAVRVAVAERQLSAKWEAEFTAKYGPQVSARWGDAKHNLSQSQWLACLLRELFGDAKVELHHRPALCNRYRNMKTGEYLPPANDPKYLIYVLKEDHAIETRVRGLGAQRSDLGQRRYLKKVARNRDKKREARKWRWPKRKLKSRAINPGWRRPKRLQPKRKWPKRPMARARRLPEGPGRLR